MCDFKFKFNNYANTPLALPSISPIIPREMNVNMLKQDNKHHLSAVHAVILQ